MSGTLLLPHRKYAILDGPLRLAYRSVATSTAATITIPSGARIGDFAVLVDYATNSTASQPTLVTPTGWTSSGEIGFTSATTGSRLAISHKILAFGDAGLSITGLDGTEGELKALYVWRVKGRPLLSVTVNDQAEEITDGNPASQTCNASLGAGISPVIVIAGAGNRGGTSGFDTQTPAFEATTNVGAGTPRLTAGRTLYNWGPVDQIVDNADKGNNNALMSLYYTFT